MKMQFWLKVFAFFVGYQFTGSIFGAFLGCFLAHFLMKKFYEVQKIESTIFQGKVSRQSLFSQITFAVLGHISKSKGQVTKDDIVLATHLMKRLNLDEKDKALAKEAFNLGKTANVAFLKQMLFELRRVCVNRGDLLRFFIEVQIQAALQDGHLANEEERILYIIAEELGLSSFQFQQMLAVAMASQRFRSGNFEGFTYGNHQGDHQYHSHQQHQYSQYSNKTSLADAYTILGVSESDEQKTIKRAYRKLMNEHHPDKLVAKGLPPEMMEVAKEKAQEIQAAYDLICKSKGWK